MEYVLLTFRFLASVLWMYSFICSIRIVLSWLPGLDNGFTRFIKSLTDPYLNFFSKNGFLRIGMIDFSPILALGIISFLAMLCNEIGYSVGISFAEFLSSLIWTAWSIVASVFGFIAIILLIRFIVLLFQMNSYSRSEFWRFVDTALNSIVYGIVRPFTGGKLVSYKNALIIDVIILLLAEAAGNAFIFQLVKLIKLIPF